MIKEGIKKSMFAHSAPLNIIKVISLDWYSWLPVYIEKPL